MNRKGKTDGGKRARRKPPSMQRKRAVKSFFSLYSSLVCFSGRRSIPLSNPRESPPLLSLSKPTAHSNADHAAKKRDPKRGPRLLSRFGGPLFSRALLGGRLESFPSLSSFMAEKGSLLLLVNGGFSSLVSVPSHLTL